MAEGDVLGSGAVAGVAPESPPSNEVPPKRKPRREKPTGRVVQGQEQVISLDPIRERRGELIRLYIIASEAMITFRDAIKKAAEDSGFSSGNVSQYIISEAKETGPEFRRKLRQLDLLFNDKKDE